MIKDSQKGVSLIITFFIMIIILSVVLSISIILYSEVKVIRNISNSIVGLYAADSGIEKVLYYDRQETLFSNGQSCLDSSTCPSNHSICNGGYCTVSVPRGLCSMFDSINPNLCTSSGSQPDSSIYCLSSSLTAGSSDNLNGCKPSICDDCSVSFSTNLDSSLNIKYSIISAKVFPSGTNSNFEVDSKGTFSGTGREIQILVTPTN